MPRSTARGLIAAVVVLAAAGCHSSSSSERAPAAAPALRGHDTDLARRENDRAFRLIADGKYADAEAVLRQSLAADPAFGPALNNLGLVHFRLDRAYDAAWDFERAARLMPQQPEPHNNLGLVLERAGKFNAAAAAYERAHALQPDNTEYLGNLARARVRNGDLDEQTRAMLEQLVLRDGRPAWRAWARATLYRIRPPATEPATSADPAATSPR